MIIIPIKWLFHWEYTLFSDKPIFEKSQTAFNQVSFPGITLKYSEQPWTAIVDDSTLSKPQWLQQAGVIAAPFCKQGRIEGFCTQSGQDRCIWISSAGFWNN